ncbi:uncharacterized protein PV09_04288 [Verruconis gallopava]|uniref:Uncharacterized protein n=1 Tax=Verruconis gallopava TaxID=253628 RepID=A0A0D2AZM3_9PEZI|nr:uncharacterized protein PV09_04288 [Verruconis gallopava]KIW04534.1 hypothetical protein PV09_04288 [Verruconis gallopava]
MQMRMLLTHALEASRDGLSACRLGLLLEGPQQTRGNSPPTAMETPRAKDPDAFLNKPADGPDVLGLDSGLGGRGCALESIEVQKKSDGYFAPRPALRRRSKLALHNGAALISIWRTCSSHSL